MDVAIRGDRASCLTFQLSQQTWLFAVAQGFGTIDGVPSAPAALARLRSECERRLRNERFRRAIDRPQAAATALLGVFARINGDLFTRSAAHDDYVTAGCSFTAALIVNGRAYILHAGGTAAYLAHRGQVTALTSDDGFEGASGSLLARALGTSAALDVAVSSAAIETGDVMILVGHRVRGEIDRDALIAHVEEAGPSEHLLVIRFDDEDHRDLEMRLLSPGAPHPSAWFLPWAVAVVTFVTAFFAVNGFGH